LHLQDDCLALVPIPSSGPFLDRLAHLPAV
jgi:hypothetical protein